MTISDAIRIPNSDISSIVCISTGNTVYMRESSINAIAKENRIQSKDDLAKSILEAYGYNPEHYNYMLLKDMKSGVINEHTYIEPIGDESIREAFELVEAFGDLLAIEKAMDVPLTEAEYVEMKPNQDLCKIANQKIGLFYEKIDAAIRNVNYNEPKEIKRRIKKCEDAIARLEQEIKYVQSVEKNKNGDRRDVHQINCVTLVRVIKNLATTIIKTVVGNYLDTMDIPEFLKQVFDIKHRNTVNKSAKAGLDAFIDIIENIQFGPKDYEAQLNRYISQISKTKMFLERELKKAEEKRTQKSSKNESKEHQVKESVVRYNSSSIQSIMHEASAE